jgi:glucokinase
MRHSTSTEGAASTTRALDRTPTTDGKIAGVSTIAVIEVGGTHATSALIASNGWAVTNQPHRADLDSHAAADVLLDAIASTAAGLEAGRWGIAMPDPFDYVHGVGRFHDVGKFDALDGVDVRSGLAERLGIDPATVTFCNDADAFTLGEWAGGAGQGAHRVVGLTLGTGVGSGWTVDGRVVDPGTPRGGRIHQVRVDGRPLEDTMSRRAIRASYAAQSGDHDADVREISQLARGGDPVAVRVLEHALTGLGRAVAGPISAFAADVVVVGGSMAASWDLFEPWVQAGWVMESATTPPPMPVALHPEDAPLLGAAIAADA